MTIQAQWTVVGAGPAGIACVGQLIDRGVEPQAIMWVDPYFAVGDLGQRWYAVSSNTKVKLFRHFLQHCSAFQIDQAPHFKLFDQDPEATCELSYIVEPLQWVTHQLTHQVNSQQGWVEAIHQAQTQWQLTLQSGQTIIASKVILAQGSEPKPPLMNDINSIPLTTALNPRALAQTLTTNETVAVFGSSHSAVLVMKHLVDLGVKRIINFYRRPLCYAVFYEDWILYDNTGLKGVAADWAQTYLENPEYYPRQLERVLSQADNIAYYLPQIDWAVYAIGFDRRSLPLDSCKVDEYDTQSGQIAPNLYGVGIAFPEVTTDRAGNVEARVGLWKFMEHIDNNIRHWLSSVYLEPPE